MPMPHAGTQAARPGAECDLDIAEQLARDHERLAWLFGQLAHSRRWRRPGLYRELSQLLLTHELAEQSVVYPALNHAVLEGSIGSERQVQSQLLTSQEVDIERFLAGLAAATSNKAEFDRILHHLHEMVTQHFYEEALTVFPLLRHLDEPGMSQALARDFRAVRNAAPIRPRPRGPHGPPFDFVSRPLLGRLDRVLDRFTMIVTSMQLGGVTWLVRAFVSSVVAPALALGVLLCIHLRSARRSKA